jgi:hypothetical protein
MTSIAKICFLVIFSFKKKNARIAAKIGKVFCKNAAVPAVVSFSPVKKKMNASPPPIIPMASK